MEFARVLEGEGRDKLQKYIDILYNDIYNIIWKIESVLDSIFHSGRKQMRKAREN